MQGCFFSLASIVFQRPQAVKATLRRLRRPLTAFGSLQKLAAMRKSWSKRILVSERNRGPNSRLLKRRNLDWAMLVRETVIHAQRVRQLPMNHLSCGSTREYQIDYRRRCQVRSPAPFIGL